TLGKIVKGAKLVKEAYVLVVPEIQRQFEPIDSGELDSFGMSNDDLAFDDALFNGNGHVGGELVEPQVDFERVRADARALIDKASTAGEAILRDAAARAKEMVARATARV